ncbi:hypothetical protein HH310_26410 [Actinoplanes sp. TBRC 11911]|uniref:hypothetical protein n=1 Tax=Actinoplanes sp. TBRC 11911 TaxID=2729386 RepID=UPI00145CBAD6|nr:hypothetical protein [Actinoplanes sp. TBRC 11911]NMO54707.1 hypothetical protein [Actinoplanes sp. TBRC 11911]
MFLTERATRVAAAAACALAVAAGCSSGGDDDAPDPNRQIDVTTMRGALLQANEIGPTWTPPDDTPNANQLVSICGGTTTAPPVPPGGQVVAASFVDEGEKGAQTLDQTALVYPDVTAAQAGQAALQGLAESCQKNLSVPAVVNADRSEPAYTETVDLQPLNQGGWTGTVVLRHKKYEPKHPGTADTAVAILQTGNVVLVDAYAIYQLGSATPAANFSADWQKLVGSVVQRVG